MYGGELPLKNEEYIDDGTSGISSYAKKYDDGTLDEILDIPDKPIFDEIDTDTPERDEFEPDDSPTLFDENGGISDYLGGNSEFIDEDLINYNNDSQIQSAELSDQTSTESEPDDDVEAIEDEITEQDIDEDVSESIEADAPQISEDDSFDEKEEPVRRVDSLFDFAEIFIFTLATVFILISFFLRYTVVEGGSMKNTLHNNEKLLLTSFLYTPECGDIVVLQDRSTAIKDPIVKRVIAVGGQTVKFTATDVYVDGIKLDEPYVFIDNCTSGYSEYRYSLTPYDALVEHITDYVDGVSYEVLVPDGYIFVMGDHRCNSRDSREIGMIHEDAIIGKAIFRFAPFSEFGKIE